MKNEFRMVTFLFCFIIIIGFSTVSDVHAFNEGDRIVLQNTLNGRNVRTERIIRPDTYIITIPDGTRGTFLQGPEEGIGNNFNWYQAEWETRLGKLEGWIAQPIGECNYVGSVEEAEKRDTIAAALFRLPKSTIDTTTYHDYNGYGCNVNWERYGGTGHAGLDVQTHVRTRNETFYSLTNGIVTIAGFTDRNGNREEDAGEADTWKTIGIYDPDKRKTTLYLHASSVHPDVKRAFKNNSLIEYGDPLGTEGDSGSLGNIHVHLEVHIGVSTSSVSGKTEGTTEDPTDYLHECIIDAQIQELLEQIENLRNELDVLDAPTQVPPSHTNLLNNYPNPFNPETWIPYQLADPMDVVINIYNSQGVLVRILPLGYQPVGYYISRSRAAYWDGRNRLGEPVASGVYFYQLKTNEMSSLRRMVILK